MLVSAVPVLKTAADQLVQKQQVQSPSFSHLTGCQTAWADSVAQPGRTDPLLLLAAVLGSCALAWQMQHAAGV